MSDVPIDLLSDLRNGIRVEVAWPKFTTFVTDHFDAILNRYSIRWLVSICDTYADYGNETQSRNALLISNFVNLLRLTETTHFRWIDSIVAGREKIDHAAPDNPHPGPESHERFARAGRRLHAGVRRANIINRRP